MPSKGSWQATAWQSSLTVTLLAAWCGPTWAHVDLGAPQRLEGSAPRNSGGCSATSSTSQPLPRPHGRGPWTCGSPCHSSSGSSAAAVLCGGSGQLHWPSCLRSRGSSTRQLAGQAPAEEQACRRRWPGRPSTSSLRRRGWPHGWDSTRSKARRSTAGECQPCSSIHSCCEEPPPLPQSRGSPARRSSSPRRLTQTKTPAQPEDPATALLWKSRRQSRWISGHASSRPASAESPPEVVSNTLSPSRA
mmetsp:Transcript_105702/g.340933  ORF Transcript_105702/g.340933 Transcript_105702/m.340933 type:complete len:247 (+) Transcript_105702:1649-2389(+)